MGDMKISDDEDEYHGWWFDEVSGSDKAALPP